MRLPESFGSYLAAAVVLLLVAAGLVVNAQSLTVVAPLHHIDGAYQTYAHLHRLATGDLPGRDFLPYLGLGPALLLYPGFDLAGQTLGAASFSAFLATGLLFVAGTAALLWLLIRSVSGRSELLWALIAASLVAGAITLALASGRSVGFLQTLNWPGNSLIGLRSVLAVVAGLLLVGLTSGRRWNPLASGIGAGLLLAWSNDYAYTSLFWLHAFLVLYWTRHIGLAAALGQAAISVGVGILVFGVAGQLLTGGHLMDLLRYNFGAVASDQFWYFPGYQPADKYLSWWDLLLYWRRDSGLASLALLLYPPALAVLVSTGRRFPLALALIGTVALSSGLLAEVGGHKELRYYSMAMYVLPFLLVGAGAVILRVPHRTLSPAVVTPVPRARVPFARGVALAAVSLLWVAILVQQGARREGLEQGGSFAWSPKLGGYVEDIDRQEVERLHELAADSSGTTVSEYRTVFDVLRGSDPSTRTDSIIHALGPEREAFVETLGAPGVTHAVTTSPTYSAWQNWSLHQNWPFYRRLITEFQPVHQGERLVVWERSSGRASEGRASSERLGCAVSEGPPGVEVAVPEAEPGGIYDLELVVEVACRKSWVPIFGNRAIVTVEAASRLGHLNGKFTVDPRARRVNVPFIARPDADRIRLQVEPAERCQVRVGECAASYVAPLAPHFYSPVPAGKA